MLVSELTVIGRKGDANSQTRNPGTDFARAVRGRRRWNPARVRTGCAQAKARLSSAATLGGTKWLISPPNLATCLTSEELV